ncbi:mobile mystery protein B [soil metagenome]
MGLELEYSDGQTPLTEEEKNGLLIRTITTHGELDEHEQLNIENAIEWLVSGNRKKETVLTEKFIRTLHKKMLGQVWSWAGEFRKSEKNIGTKWINIEVELRTLLQDTNYWIENKTYSPDELAIQFKHRLVKIHCFANGNGRHSRIMADLLIESVLGEKIFSWNESNLVKADEIRKEYIRSIKEADNGNIIPLIEFARR